MFVWQHLDFIHHSFYTLGKVVIESLSRKFYFLFRLVGRLGFSHLIGYSKNDQRLLSASDLTNQVGKLISQRLSVAEGRE